MTLSKLTDSELMAAYCAGDCAAFEELYRRHAGRVYAYLQKRLFDGQQAEDLFQAIFFKLHRARDRFDPCFPFEAWLFAICRGVLIDHLRKLGRSPQQAQADVSLLPAASADGASAADLERLVAAAKLSEEQQQAIKLRYQNDFSFAQIARVLDKSPAGVRQLVSRAVRKLRAALAGN